MVNLKNRCIYDVIVLGTGISGLTTALTLGRHGLNVLCVTKNSDPLATNSVMAQGGIIFRGSGDSSALLAQDIMHAGADICHRPAVDFLAKHGPDVVESLLIRDLKVPFDTENGGHLHLTSEGAHSCPRIIHVADYTGKAIEQVMLNAVKNHPNIDLVTDLTAIDLLTIRHHSTSYEFKYNLENECVGVYLFHNGTREVIAAFSNAVVLATGGCGHLYSHTTNWPGSIGQGMVMASRAGAYLLNTEYVQFHPTALYRTGADRFLISESLRGEGARLINLSGEPFMERYDPELQDLAPRDVVARAILEEMTLRGEECVLLDLASHYKGSISIQERFPTIYRECQKYGIDISREPIPVVPAAHYFCGGVLSNTEGQTTIRRLYAVGEVSCTGIHGANRLASSSLLEGLTWGYYTALSIGKTLAQGRRLSRRILETIPDWIPSGQRDDEDPALILQDWTRIRSTMWNYAGITRTKERLERAVADLGDLSKRLTLFYHESLIDRKSVV